MKMDWEKIVDQLEGITASVEYCRLEEDEDEDRLNEITNTRATQLERTWIKLENYGEDLIKYAWHI